MKHLLLLLGCFACFLTASGQVTVEPEFPASNESVTITYDASQGSSNLQGAAKVFMHSGVIIDAPTGTDWQHVVGDWGDPNSPGEMTNIGTDLWSITLTPNEYYSAGGLEAGTQVFRLGMVFREAGPCGGYNGASNSCAEGKTDAGSDFFVDMSDGSLTGKWNAPLEFPKFVDVNEGVLIDFETNLDADIALYVNNTLYHQELASKSLQVTYTPVVAGNYELKIVATSGSESIEKIEQLIARAPVVNAPLPADVTAGINYISDTEVVLCLWAPLKESVYVVGEFNGFEVQSAYQLNKDGEYFWITLDGLNSGQEYAFQYLVDEHIYVADPYADKILDPDDAFIPASIYPNLKTYPAEALHAEWYKNRLSVLETGQTTFTWEVVNFERPEKENLIVYELLIRDFFDPDNRSYDNLIDTLNYIKKLGVNAIELMPIMEFNGNESWGYNTTFFFAPDKAYGSKTTLKKLVDEAHKMGIAVVLDIVLNHNDVPSPFAAMYYDFDVYQPTAENPWFNVEAKHPFNVFNDFNHESSHTQILMDQVLSYWIKEYKIDGYRFDLSKGFTQQFNTDVGAWSSRDQSRIDLLKRMYNKVRTYDANAYLILEHFADNQEEIELANHGFMLWDNGNHPGTQNAMGFAEDSNLEWYHYSNKNWAGPNNVQYIESHDEERISYKVQEFGNTSTGYTTKTVEEALERSKGIHVFNQLIPGPKMLWQFEELGYDVSINEGGRTGNKPLKWSYFEEPKRRKLYDLIGVLHKMKSEFSVFKSHDIQLEAGATEKKQFTIKNIPYLQAPTSEDEANVVVVGNFGVTLQDFTFTFPHSGNWYHYFNQNEPTTLSEVEATIRLQPGEVRVYFDFPMPLLQEELLAHLTPLAPTGFQVEEALPNGIDLSWEDQSSIETGYEVYKSIDGVNFTLLITLDENTTAFTDHSGILPEKEYWYKVVAFNKVDGIASEVKSVITSNLITSLEETAHLLSVYPNPARDQLRIESVEDIQEVSMLDMHGKIINSWQINGKSHVLNIDQINPGVYWLRFWYRKGRINKKIIINR